MGRNPNLEYRTYKFDVSPASLKQDAPKGIVDGYAAVFHNIDHQGDVIAPGAFARTLAERELNFDVFIGHNWHGLPVGLPLAIREDEHGLWTSTQLFETSDGADVLGVIEGLARSPNGKRLGMSIGFEIRSADFEERDGQSVRVLDDIELVEYSFVAMPANELARVIDAKGNAPKHQADLRAIHAWADPDGSMSKREFAASLKDLLHEFDEEQKAAPEYRIRSARLAQARAARRE